MLQLPDDWHQWTTEEVVADLLKQANAIGKYAEAARAMVKASIDFMLAGPRWSNREHPYRFKTLPNGFQLNDWVFYVLPATSDDAFHTIANIPKIRGDIDLLAPPWSQFLYRHAVKSAYPKRRIDVISIDAFCDTRLFWTGLDIQVLLKRSDFDSRSDFINRYRTLTQSTPALTIRPLPTEQLHLSARNCGMQGEEPEEGAKES